MSLIGGTSDSDFSFDGLGNFDFGDLIGSTSTNSSSKVDLKLEGITKTEVFSHCLGEDFAAQDFTEFYDAKIFAKLNDNEIPDREKVLVGLLIEKEGLKPVLMTRSGEACSAREESN